MTQATLEKRRRPGKLGDLFVRWSFMLPTIVLLMAVLAYPIFYTLEISFSRFDLSTFGAGEWVGWDNYETVLQDYRFWDSLRVTLIYLVIALPLQMVLGFGIAFLINAEWSGRGSDRALFIIPMVVAPVVAGGIWRMILDPLWGVMNYVLGLVGSARSTGSATRNLAMATIVIIDTWRWTPFVVLIATAALLCAAHATCSRPPRSTARTGGRRSGRSPAAAGADHRGDLRGALARRGEDVRHRAGRDLWRSGQGDQASSTSSSTRKRSARCTLPNRRRWR